MFTALSASIFSGKAIFLCKDKKTSLNQHGNDKSFPCWFGIVNENTVIYIS
jgi:hypothetical protein